MEINNYTSQPTYIIRIRGFVVNKDNTASFEKQPR